MRTDEEQATWDELQAYTLELGDAEFIHQHAVDAWAAQHADESTRPIVIAFALFGLFLKIERGLSGRTVQRLHMVLARRRRDWPPFELPPERGAIRVVDVVAAPRGSERDKAIDAWCASVWEAFRESHQAVVSLLRRNGIE